MVVEQSVNKTSEKQGNSRFTRHPLLALWLFWILLASATNILRGALPTIAQTMLELRPTYPVWTLQAGALIGFLTFVFAVAVIQQKKWGFFGICMTGIMRYIMIWYAGLSGGFYGGLIMAIVLFFLLHLGKEDKEWNKLTW